MEAEKSWEKTLENNENNSVTKWNKNAANRPATRKLSKEGTQANLEYQILPENGWVQKGQSWTSSFKVDLHWVKINAMSNKNNQATHASSISLKQSSIWSYLKIWKSFPQFGHCTVQEVH